MMPRGGFLERPNAAWPVAAQSDAAESLTAQPEAQQDCARFTLRRLEQIGLWSDARAPSGWLRRLAPWLGLAQSAYGVIAQTVNVVQTWGKMVIAAEYCVALLQLTMTCVKISCLFVNAVPIRDLLTSLAALRSAHAPDDDVTRILRRTRTASDKFVRALHGLCVPALVGTIVGAIELGYRRRTVVFRRWYPFEAKSSPMFETTLLSYGILAFYDYYSILMFDLLFLSLVMETIGEFRVLRHHLEHIDHSGNVAQRQSGNAASPRSGNTAGTKIYDTAGTGLGHVAEPARRFGNLLAEMQRKEPTARESTRPRHFLGVSSSGVRTPWSGAWSTSAPARDVRRPSAQCPTPEERLGACVVRHQELIRLVAQLESAFQPGMVISLVCNFCVGLTLAFVTLKMDRFDIKVASMASIGIVCVGEFALYCHLCTQLATESARVGESVYACAWWDARAGFKRSLRIVQLRADRPLFVRAGAIFPMSMETFTKVMNAAYNMYNLMITTN